MKESATISFDYADIENLLFDYYFGDSHPKIKKQIDETGKMICDVKTKEGIVKTKAYINFILTFEKPVESLNKSINTKIIVTLKELCDIINEKISDQDYEVDEIDDCLMYDFEKSTKTNLKKLTFSLKKKNIKIKKKGL